MCMEKEVIFNDSLSEACMSPVLIIFCALQGIEAGQFMASIIASVLGFCLNL